MSAENWVEKYRPRKLSDVVGNAIAIQELREWAQSWLEDIPESRAIIIYGKQGIGKTSCGYALANEMGWEITELNASDQRTKTKIENTAGTGARMGTIEGSKRLIILDEADNFYVREDKGGENAAINIIMNTKQPMILIANEFYDMTKAMRSSCRSIEFKPISISQIIGVLKTIAKSENVTYEIDAIEKIASNADGDLRGAINDLQAIGQNVSHIKLEDIIVGKRNNNKNIFEVLRNIFRATNAKESYEAISNIDKDPEELIQWIDENISVEYTRPRDLNDAYYYISKSATFLSRVRKRNNYRMWKYASFLMTAGVFASSRKRRTESLRYHKPQIIDKFWQTKSMRTVRDSLAKKIGIRCHTSIGFARCQLFPFFRAVMMNTSYAEYVVASLELNPEEIAFIMDLEPNAKKIYEIYDRAQLIIREDTGYIIESSSEINKKVEEEKTIGKYGKAQITIDDAWG
jgi:replication factor C large subunit